MRASRIRLSSKARSLSEPKFGTGVTLAALLLATAPAFAAQGDQSSSSGETAAASALPEVTVTAQFRSQNLQKTPIAITAMTADMLESRSQTSVVELANQAPNVTLEHGSPSTSGPGLQAFIRGIGQYDFNYAFEPGVGMYIDDVYYSTLTGSDFDLLDLDRVEIARGPQGTLAGMNSIGGSIKLFTKKPNGNNGGYLEATYGSYNRTDVRGAADFTLVKDQLFARVAGVARSQDGYVTRYDYACTHPALAATYNIPSYQDKTGCKLGTEGGKAYVGARTSIRWLASDRLEINLSGDITRDNSEASPQTLLFVGTYSPAGITPGDPNTSFPRNSTAPTNGLPLWDAATGTSPFITYSPYGNYAGDTFTNSPYVNYSTYMDTQPSDGTPPWKAVPKSYVNSWGLSGKINYQVTDDIEFISVSAYRRFSAYWAQDYDASPIGSAQLTYDTWHRQFSQEVRLQGNLFDSAVNWVVGGFYFDQKSHYGGRNALGVFEFIEDDQIPASNKAVFGNVSWNVTDALQLNAGIRYTSEKKTFEFGRGGILGNAYPPCVVNGVSYGNVHPAFCGLNGASGKFSGHKVDYRAVVQYQWTPSLMTYASVATGFKGGGVNPRPFFPDQAIPFGQETLRAFEVGAKTSWFDNRIRANASVFVNRYNNIITSFRSTVGALPNPSCLPNPNEALCSYYLNAGRAQLRGAELEIDATPIDNFLIDASLSYLDFKYKHLTGCLTATDPSCIANSGGLGSGLTYDMTTPYAPKWKYSVGAQYEFRIAGAGSLTPRLDLSHQSSVQTTAINSPATIIRGYTLLNGRVTWRDRDDTWSVALEVTNITKKLYYTGIIPNNNAFVIVGSPAAPREWAVTVKRKF